MYWLLAKISAITVIKLAALIFLMLVGGERVAVGWQISIASRIDSEHWQLQRLDLDRRLNSQKLFPQEVRMTLLLSPDGRFIASDNPYALKRSPQASGIVPALPAGIPQTWSPDTENKALVAYLFAVRNYSLRTYIGEIRVGL